MASAHPHHVLSAPVVGSDESDLGTVARVAVHPVTHEVTHLIVQGRGLLGERRVVPLEDVTRLDAPEGTVRLSLDADGFAHCPPYQESDFLPPNPDWEGPGGTWPAGVVWPAPLAWTAASSYPVLSNQVVRTNIPEDDVTLKPGTAVECVDGHCGSVADVRVDARTHALTGFVLRRGLLFTRDLEAPLSWIDHVTENAVHLKLSKAQVETFDAEARGEIE